MDAKFQAIRVILEILNMKEDDAKDVASVLAAFEDRRAKRIANILMDSEINVVSSQTETQNVSSAKGTLKTNTTDGWIALGGYTLSPGEYVKVQGINDDYIVSRNEHPPSVICCSCPAWTFQHNIPIQNRTCKHCIAVTGKNKI
jgi:hypothetical protein